MPKLTKKQRKAKSRERVNARKKRIKNKIDAQNGKTPCLPELKTSDVIAAKQTALQALQSLPVESRRNFWYEIGVALKIKGEAADNAARTDQINQALQTKNLKLVPVTSHDGGQHYEIKGAPALWTTFQKILGPDEQDVFINSRYQVIKREEMMGDQQIICLHITRLDRACARDWRDFQRIKNELVGEEAEGIELFPAESRLIDMSNEYRLYCVQAPKKLQFGEYSLRIVSEDAEGTGLRQEPFETKPADLMTKDEVAAAIAGNVATSQLSQTTSPKRPVPSWWPSKWDDDEDKDTMLGLYWSLPEMEVALEVCSAKNRRDKAFSSRIARLKRAGLANYDKNKKAWVRTYGA